VTFSENFSPFQAARQWQQAHPALEHSQGIPPDHPLQRHNLSTARQQTAHCMPLFLQYLLLTLPAVPRYL